MEEKIFLIKLIRKGSGVEQFICTISEDKMKDLKEIDLFYNDNDPRIIIFESKPDGSYYRRVDLATMIEIERDSIRNKAPKIE